MQRRKPHVDDRGAEDLVEKASWRARLRYRFDNLMSGGSGSILLALGVLTTLSVLALAGLRAALHRLEPDPTAHSWRDILWRALTEIIDPGSLEG
ncbi:MAG: hypothetical protein D6776_10905, partial [Planctomycetota bacterium]